VDYGAISQTLSGAVSGGTVAAFAATVVLSLVAGTWRSGPRAAPAPESAPAPGLPVERADPDSREYAAVGDLVAALVAEEEWAEIAVRIAGWERLLETTPGGIRYHQIAVETCLAALQGALDAMPRQDLGELEPAERELSHFLDRHRSAHGAPVPALLAARAHLAIAESCHAEYWPEVQAKPAWRRRARHVAAAQAILAGFDPVAHMSPLLAEAHYLATRGLPGGEDRLESAFDDWIDLDPANPEAYALHVPWLAEALGDDWAALAAEAERAVRRAEATHGTAGYALFCRPLFAADPGARAHMDTERFAQALFDMAAFSGNQSEVNWAAAELAEEIAESAPGRVAPLTETLMLLMRQHLRVIYPRLWPLPESEIAALAEAAWRVVPDLEPALAA